MKNLILILAIAFVAITSNLEAQQEIVWKSHYLKLLSTDGSIDPGYIQNVCFTPDDKYLILSCSQRTFLIEALTGKYVKDLIGVTGVFRFSNDGKYIYTYDGRKINFETNEVIGTFNINGKTPPKFYAMDVSEKAGVMVGIIRNGYPYNNWTKDIYVFDLATFNFIDTIGEKDNYYYSFELAQDASFFITSSEYVTEPFTSTKKEYKSMVWDSKLRKPLFENTSIGYFRTSKDGKWIASASGNQVSLFDALTFERKYLTTQGGGGTLTGVAFSPDSRYYAICGNTGGNDLNDIQVRGLESGKVTYRYSNSTKGDWAQDKLNYSNDGKYLAGWSTHGIAIYYSYFETTRVDPIIGGDTLIVSPNPATKKISIIIDNLKYNFKIINQVGKEIFVQSNLINNTLDIDVSSLSNGCYYLVLTQNNISKLYKFIKE